jgi:TPR repeat protein
MITQNQSFSTMRHPQTGNTNLIIIVAIAVVVLAVGAYMLFFNSSGGVIEPSAPLPPTAKQAKPDDARDIINTLKASTEVDYDNAYDQASEFLRDGDVADAQLLYFFAAREGHGPSAFVLAGLYDPVDFNSASSLMDNPDGFQAFKWYNKALEAGETEAAGRLDALKAWSEKAAAEGDVKASQLLLQWEQ